MVAHADLASRRSVPRATTKMDPPVPHRHLVDAHVLLVDGPRLLLTERRGGEFDHAWHLPSGKVESGEDVLSAAAREAAEEIGVHIDPADLVHVHTTHITGSGHEPRFGLFFSATRWRGEPANLEPDKCYRVGWFDLVALPAPLIDYTAAGIEGYRRGAPFSVRGWC